MNTVQPASGSPGWLKRRATQIIDSSFFNEFFSAAWRTIWAWWAIAAMIAAALTWLDYRTIRLSSRAADETAYFASELQNEAGPDLEDYRRAANTLRQLLTAHLDSLKARPQFALYSGRFTPIPLQTSLTAANNLLQRDFRSVEDASNAVSEAGAYLREYVTNVWAAISEEEPKYSGKLTAITPSLLEQAHVALSNFHAFVSTGYQGKEFETNRFERVKHECELSRQAGGLFQIISPEVRDDNDWKPLIARFGEDLNTTRNEMYAFTNDYPQSSRLDSVVDYSMSVSRRLYALQAITSGNYAKLRCRLVGDCNVRQHNRD